MFNNDNYTRDIYTFSDWLKDKKIAEFTSERQYLLNAPVMWDVFEEQYKSDCIASEMDYEDLNEM